MDEIKYKKPLSVEEQVDYLEINELFITSAAKKKTIPKWNSLSSAL